MGAIAFQITSLTIVYSADYSDADQRKHQSAASLAFVPAQTTNAENVSIWWRHHDFAMRVFLGCWSFLFWQTISVNMLSYGECQDNAVVNIF